jgi:ribosomal protein L1
MPSTKKIERVAELKGQIEGSTALLLTEYRADRTGNVHLIIGKKSFEERNLLENYLVVVDELLKAKPSSAKGRYIKSLAVSSTMGPSVRIDSSKPRGVQTLPADR